MTLVEEVEQALGKPKLKDGTDVEVTVRPYFFNSDQPNSIAVKMTCNHARGTIDTQQHLSVPDMLSEGVGDLVAQVRERMLLYLEQVLEADKASAPLF